MTFIGQSINYWLMCCYPESYTRLIQQPWCDVCSWNKAMEEDKRTLWRFTSSSRIWKWAAFAARLSYALARDMGPNTCILLQTSSCFCFTHPDPDFLCVCAESWCINQGQRFILKNSASGAVRCVGQISSSRWHVQFSNNASTQVKFHVSACVCVCSQTTGLSHLGVLGRGDAEEHPELLGQGEGIL